jgi:hypothetical protein
MPWVLTAAIHRAAVKLDLVRIAQIKGTDDIIKGRDQVEKTPLKYGDTCENEVSLVSVQDRSGVIHIE